jgi:hypothetical protein
MIYAPEPYATCLKPDFPLSLLPYALRLSYLKHFQYGLIWLITESIVRLIDASASLS